MAEKVPRELLTSLRRMHINTGHPTNDDLVRILRLAEAPFPAKVVKGLRCSVCARTSRPRSSNPAKVRNNVGIFNHTIMADLGYVDDYEDDQVNNYDHDQDRNNDNDD